MKNASASDFIVLAKDIGEDDINKIHIVLDQFEFLTASMYNGDIDERFMRDCEESLFVGAPKYFRDIIEEPRKREIDPQPTAYRALDDIVSRWTTNPPGPLQRLIEWVVMRPLRNPQKWALAVDNRLRMLSRDKQHRAENLN